MTESMYASLEDWAFRKQLMLAVAFTDIVGSTPLRQEIGDEAMEGMVQRHFVTAREYINQHARDFTRCELLVCALRLCPRADREKAERNQSCAKATSELRSAVFLEHLWTRREYYEMACG